MTDFVFSVTIDFILALVVVTGILAAILNITEKK